MDLNELRLEINDINDEILELMRKRMALCEDVARYKIANGMKVFQADREKAVIDSMREKAGDDLANSAEVLFTNIMDIGKCRQFQLMFENDSKIPFTPIDLSGKRSVAVPGTVGAFSHLAAKKFLPDCEPVFFESFSEIFAAVESGSVEFGVVPIINSTTGSVSQTYELMRRHDFKICACTKVAADHCFVAKKETKRENIKRVYSHEQALMQCSNFLSQRGLSTRTAENTSLAAAFIKDSDEPYGAICSEVCANHFGLEILDRSIADNECNFTKFILITKDTSLLDGADIISVSFTLPHQASSLYRLLTKFFVAGLNLTMIESRPIANTDFEVLFYLDFEGSIKSPDVAKLMKELETELAYFRFLGNYKEV